MRHIRLQHISFCYADSSCNSLVKCSPVASCLYGWSKSRGRWESVKHAAALSDHSKRPYVCVLACVSKWEYSPSLVSGWSCKHCPPPTPHPPLPLPISVQSWWHTHRHTHRPALTRRWRPSNTVTKNTEENVIVLYDIIMTTKPCHLCPLASKQVQHVNSMK